jgi:mycofactocin precursor
MDTTTPTLTEAPAAGDQLAEQAELVEQELLVEEISIDGMCGVY